MSIISIDMGGTRIKIGAFENDELREQVIIPAQADEPMPIKLANIRAQIESWVQQSLTAVTGIALSIPGIVDRTLQKVISINGKHIDAPETDFVKWAADNFQCPLVLQNDAIAAIMGEWKYGAGLESQNVVMVTLGTGIGTGAVVDGHLLQGAQHFAGNLGGHTVMSNNPTHQCNCGAIGCAEAQASTWALGSDLKTLWAAAETGDQNAQQHIEHTLWVWANLIHNLILAYSPDRVIVGGGIAGRGQQLLNDLIERLPANIWYRPSDIEFRLAERPDLAAVLGGLAKLKTLNSSLSQ